MRAAPSIHDPAFGVRRLSLDEVSKHFTGIALELSPTPTSSPPTIAAHVRLRQLLGRVVGLERSLAQVFVLALALAGLRARDAVLHAVGGRWRRGLRRPRPPHGAGPGLPPARADPGEPRRRCARGWCCTSAPTLNLQWLANVFAHLLRLPVSWFEKRHLGDVVSRFGAVNKIQHTLTTSFVEALIDGVMVVVDARDDARLQRARSRSIAAGAVVALRRCCAGPSTVRCARDRGAHRAHRQAAEPLPRDGARRAVDQALRPPGGAALALAEPRGRCDEPGPRHAEARARLPLGQRLVFGVERVAIVWLGALLVLDGGFSVGMLFAFMAYKDQFSARVGGLIDKVVELQMLRLQGERLADIVLTAPEQEPGSMPRRPDRRIARGARALLPLLGHGALRAAQLLVRASSPASRSRSSDRRAAARPRW